jgi:CheY-like chemotaxis protein
LVEDNPDDVALTLRAFKKQNILNRVVVAKDGAEALERLFGRQSDPRMPSVILLDLKLPKVDGIEVLKKIRAHERTKFIPTIVLTSSKEEVDLLRSYENGANSYIRKPVEFKEFLETVNRLGMYWMLLNERIPEQ